MSFNSSIAKKIEDNVGNDFKRVRTQLILILISLGIISFGMTLLNYFTDKSGLLLATAIFSVFSFISALVGIKDKMRMNMVVILFSIETITLFTYFIIYGGTEGFSTIWLLLMAACGPFALGMVRGIALSSILLVELIFFFYIPLGKDLLVCTDYTDSFIMRFPIVFGAFMLLGILLEMIRKATYNQMIKSKEKFEYLSKHDILTGLYNRVGFNVIIETCVEKCSQGKGFALILSDIDFFKNVNDTYGHTVGDEVLISVADRINKGIIEFGGIACRWGGEEFAFLIADSSANEYVDIAEKLKDSVADPIYTEVGEIKITCSFGAVHSSKLDKISARELVASVDRLLYDAKENGRNQVKYL